MRGASRVSGWGVIRMITRATCHYEVRGTCSQEKGSLQTCFEV